MECLCIILVGNLSEAGTKAGISIMSLTPTRVFKTSEAAQPTSKMPRLSDFSAGTVSALVMISFAVSYGAMAFSDPLLQPYVTIGVRGALVTTWVLLAINAFWSSFPFSLAGPDSNSTILLALAGASIAHEVVARQGGPGMVLGSVLMFFLIATVFVGIATWTIGALKRGGIIAFLPCPVTGGFLAGTGILVAMGALKVLLGKNVTLANLAAFRDPTSIGIFVLLVAGLQIIPRLYKSIFTFPVLILLGTGLFYGSLHFQALDIDAARKLGMLISSPTGSIGPIPTLEVDWMALAEHWTAVLPLMVIVVLTTLFNTAGLDVVSPEDGNFDHELKGIGVALIVSGALGGFLGHTSASRSLMHRLAGARTPAGGLWAASICCFVTYFYPDILAFLPRTVLAALLFSMGLGMIMDWGVQSYFRLPFLEYLLTAMVALIIASVGPIAGVITGLLFTSILFVFNYSRIDCIRHMFCVGERFSIKDRPIQQMEILRKHGESCRILELQGFVFFGTSNNIVNLLRELVKKSSPKLFIMDFRMVQGVDASAVYGFAKLAQIFAREKVALVFSGMRTEMEALFRRGGLNEKLGVRFEVDLETALEQAEDGFLAEFREKSRKEQIEGGALPPDPAAIAIPRISTEAVPAADAASMEAEATIKGNGALPPDSQKRKGPLQPVFGYSGFHMFQGFDFEASRKAFSEGSWAQMDAKDILAPFMLDPKMLEILLGYCEVLEIDQGAMLFKRGDPTTGMYFLERGTLSIFLTLPGGERKRLRTLGPGSVVGEMSLYSRQPRSADAEARTQCRLRWLSIGCFDRLTREHPEVCNEFHRFIVKLLSFRLAGANAQILALS